MRGSCSKVPVLILVLVVCACAAGPAELGPAEVAVLVFRKASPAVPSAASWLPALKPNQPTHRRAAPMTVRGRLWGGMGTLRKPPRGPR